MPRSDNYDSQAIVPKVLAKQLPCSSSYKNLVHGISLPEMATGREEALQGVGKIKDQSTPNTQVFIWKGPYFKEK